MSKYDYENTIFSIGEEDHKKILDEWKKVYEIGDKITIVNKNGVSKVFEVKNGNN